MNQIKTNPSVNTEGVEHPISPKVDRLQQQSHHGVSHFCQPITESWGSNGQKILHRLKTLKTPSREILIYKTQGQKSHQQHHSSLPCVNRHAWWRWSNGVRNIFLKHFGPVNTIYTPYIYDHIFLIRQFFYWSKSIFKSFEWKTWIMDNTLSCKPVNWC